MALSRRRFLEALTAGASTAIAGCGGDGTGGEPAATSTPNDDGATPTATATPTGSTGRSAQEAYPEYEWSQLEDATPVATTEVVMENFAFEPLIATVSPGTTVTFVNEDSSSHTVTIPKLDVDETVAGGESTTVTFEDAGTYDYVCTFHPTSMLGRIVVEESTSGEASQQTTTGGGDGYY